MSDQSSVESYRDLEVWQQGIVLVERVYEATDGFPDREQYELTSQLRRAAVAIPSNIAEGWGYSSRDQYVYYLEQARSLLLEVETQLIIAERLSYYHGGYAKRSSPRDDHREQNAPLPHALPPVVSPPPSPLTSYPSPTPCACSHRRTAERRQVHPF